MISFPRHVARLVKPFWVSDHALTTWGLFAVILAAEFGTVYLAVLFNFWNNDFYNAIQTMDPAAFGSSLLTFSGLAAVFTLVAVYNTYLTGLLTLRWRRHLTDRLIGRWLGERVHHLLQVKQIYADNPDQRIQEDIDRFTTQSIRLFFRILNATVTLFSFIFILWGLSGSLEVTLFGQTVVIEGYLVWAAVAYNIVGTALAHWIGRPLITLLYDKQAREADFRYSLVRLRDHSEQITQMGGEAAEARVLGQRFAAVCRNTQAVLNRTKALSFFQASFSQVAIVFPFITAGPRFFSGALSFGGLMQISNAFGQVQSTLSFFVHAYTDIADWKAVTDRLTRFEQALWLAERKTDEEAIRRVRWHAAKPGQTAPASHQLLRSQALCLTAPMGGQILDGITLEIQPGERVLIQGPSGIGKSTFLRAISGSWRFGQGTLWIPPEPVSYMPQRPYLPLGTLRQAVTYPDPGDKAKPGEVEGLLRTVGLPALIGRLDEEQAWDQILSLGQQQKLAFARVLLRDPAWIFLDEATSSLDRDAEAWLYGLLVERETTLVSIGHRPELVRFHTRCIDFTAYRDLKAA